MVILVCSCVLSGGVSRHPRFSGQFLPFLGVVRYLPGVDAVRVTLPRPRRPSGACWHSPEVYRNETDSESEDLRVRGRGIPLSCWFPTVFLGTLGYSEEQQEHLSLLAPPWLAAVSQWTEATWCLTTDGLTHGWAERALGVLFTAWHMYLRIHVCWITGSNEAWIWGKPQCPLQLPWVADEKLGPAVHSSRRSYTQFLGREDSHFV